LLGEETLTLTGGLGILKKNQKIKTFRQRFQKKLLINKKTEVPLRNVFLTHTTIVEMYITYKANRAPDSRPVLAG
jgi:hypothetical protein